MHISEHSRSEFWGAEAPMRQEKASFDVRLR